MNKHLLFGTCLTTLAVLPMSIAVAQDSVITIATIGEPASLDMQTVVTDITGMIGQHIFETLYAYDAAWAPKPLLASAMPSVSEDGLVYTIPLREGITFHDGSEMTSEDVVASLERWMTVHFKGRQMAGLIESVTAGDAHTVTITLNAPYAPLTTVLVGGAVIMPVETLAETLTEFVGTGPYMLKERRPDQFIQLVRFDDYRSPDGEPDGTAGRREAVADELLFVPVPDANTRVEGLLAGEYDYADSLPFSAYDRIEASEVAKPVIFNGAGWISMNMNMQLGILTSKPLRQAVQVALNASDLMAAAFDDPKFFSVDGAFYPEGYFWHTDTGVVRYGDGDIEAAAALMAEASYDGEPLRILTSRQYEYHYKLAQVAEAYLEAAGFNVDLQVVDWATLTTRRSDPTAWDIFITHSAFASDPTMMNTLSDAYPGWYVSEQRAAAIGTYLEAVTPEERFAAWEQIQTVLYDDVPLYKAGNFNGLSGVANDLDGYRPLYWPVFWNVTVDN